VQNHSIEIHDSTVETISLIDGLAIIEFSKVYIHKSTGAPGLDAGTIWVQKAALRIGQADVQHSFAEFPAVLLDGYLKLDGRILKNMIPIPLDYKQAVELRLESWNEAFVLIAGTTATVKLIGDPRYVEEFPGAKGPRSK
jgi:hypothetical protein